MSTNLQVADLDFDKIKSNFTEFIKAKPAFTDADFEGSGLSILTDILAYNTYYNAVTANMLVPEMFLQTAVKRATACLHAKRMGYVPRSARAPMAVLTVEVFPTDTPATLTLGKNAVFSSTISGSTLSFVTTTATTTTPDVNGRYIFNGVEVYEGTLTTFRYAVGDPTTDRYVIPTANVDTTLLNVRVQQSSTNTTTTIYQRYDTIVDVGSTTPAYFLKINEAGLYEVYFGDGVLGLPVQHGNIVTLEYIDTNATVGNGCFSFSFNDSIGGYGNIVVNTQLAALGGMDFEDIDSIKFNAQQRVLAQDRAVTSTDYEAIVPELYPCDSISVWGGEKNDPPVYGKVFISIKPLRSTDILTTATKTYITNQLINTKNVVTVIPEIVDPDYTNLIIDSTVYFNAAASQYSAEAIQSIVAGDIFAYLSGTVNKFKKNLRYSQFVRNIDDSDSSIIGNVTNLRMKKSVQPNTGFLQKYRVAFNNPIEESSNLVQQISSSGFTIYGSNSLCYIDDWQGVARMYTMDGGVKTIINTNVGSVDYSTGTIIINSQTITSSTPITFTVNPASSDVFTVRNSILIINQADITVNVIAESPDVVEHISTLRS